MGQKREVSAHLPKISSQLIRRWSGHRSVITCCPVAKISAAEMGRVLGCRGGLTL